jgi:hypothetical protein
LCTCLVTTNPIPDHNPDNDSSYTENYECSPLNDDGSEMIPLD